MYQDAQNTYSQAQALVATAVSTNAIDHGANRRMGIGEALAIVLDVLVSAAGGGTLQITLQADTTSAFGAPVTVAQTAAIAAATLIAGYQLVIAVPPDSNFTRWSRLNYTMVTMTGITVTAFLTLEQSIQNAVQYAAGITVQ